MRARDETHQQFNQEFLLSSPVGQTVEYLAGIYYQDEELDHVKFTDVLLSNAGFVVGNAAETEASGMEADGSVILTEQLALSGGFAYLGASYKSFPDAACNEPQIIAWIASGGSRSTCAQDLSGEPLQFSPEFSAHIALDFATNATDTLELRLGLDMLYSDDYQVANDLDPAVAQDAYYKVNARSQLASMAQTWSIALLGKNLTDEKNTTWGNDVPLAGQGFGEAYFQHIDPPRSLEIQARCQF